MREKESDPETRTSRRQRLNLRAREDSQASYWSIAALKTAARCIIFRVPDRPHRETPLKPGFWHLETRLRRWPAGSAPGSRPVPAGFRPKPRAFLGSDGSFSAPSEPQKNLFGQSARPRGGVFYFLFVSRFNKKKNPTPTVGRQSRCAGPSDWP